MACRQRFKRVSSSIVSLGKLPSPQSVFKPAANAWYSIYPTPTPCQPPGKVSGSHRCTWKEKILGTGKMVACGHLGVRRGIPAICFLGRLTEDKLGKMPASQRFSPIAPEAPNTTLVACRWFPLMKGRLQCFSLAKHVHELFPQCQPTYCSGEEQLRCSLLRSRPL